MRPQWGAISSRHYWPRRFTGIGGKSLELIVVAYHFVFAVAIGGAVMPIGFLLLLPLSLLIIAPHQIRRVMVMSKLYDLGYPISSVGEALPHFHRNPRGRGISLSLLPAADELRLTPVWDEDILSESQLAAALSALLVFADPELSEYRA